MGFTFFSPTPENLVSESQLSTEPSTTASVAYLECKRITCNETSFHIIGEQLHLSENLSFYKRNTSDINYTIANAQDANDVSNSILKKSDLVSGVYEGGLKTWECSMDLCIFLNSLVNSGYVMNGKDVLEVGCGTALPGLLAYANNANVDFQDYNEDVLRIVTIPNVLLNAQQEVFEINHTGTFETQFDVNHMHLSKCNFYSGDWSSFQNALNGKQYDLILSSETLYNFDALPRLYSLLKLAVKRPSGEIYIAAKTNYFGCSGSLDSFRLLIQQDISEERLVFETVYVNSDTVRREIIKLTPRM